MSDARSRRRRRIAGIAAAWLIGALPASSCRLGNDHGDERSRAHARDANGRNARDYDVRIRANNEIVLAGTFTRPTGSLQPVPVVVLIGGSGQQDRDGTRVELAGYHPLRDLADSLAAVGIATLRMDDRGTGASSGQFADATTLDFAGDVEAAIGWLRARRDVDGENPALLGHSEGALVALIAASRDSSVAALVLLGAPSRTGRELARWQRAALVASDGALFDPSERRAVLSRAEENAERAAADNPWLRVWFSLDPRAIARRTRAPALVLHGRNDRQVPVEQAAELAEALSTRRPGESAAWKGRAAPVELRRFSSTDHLFLEDYDGEPSGYVRLANRTIRPDVSNAITTWLQQRFDANGAHRARVATGATMSSRHVRARVSEEKSCAPEEKTCAPE